ncbi:amidase [Thermobifida halotolerans]|uniref:Amidase n=1 Tax=Thermobifida halotolerans TaxID=483545 RepID=A0AA97M232_9ACTN|nr:amidase [Thermobifida halotolerans]UOE17687.1 amidase [Thermobifida halotolerans]
MRHQHRPAARPAGPESPRDRPDPADYPEWGARRVRDLVTGGALRATEVAELALERIRRVDPAIRAFAEVWAEEAGHRAALVDRMLAEGHPLPLAGVPIAVKGTEQDRSHQARRLLAAGCVPVGATSVPGPGTEWQTWGTTERGRTVNPWCPDRTPGGSSAGSGAAVAAGMVPLATASDGAGSTRIPAAWCGAVGYKPTTGLLPARDRAGLTVGGPIARTVADVALYRQVVLGAPPPPDTLPPDRPPRAVWSTDLGFADVDAAVAAVARAAARDLADTGAVVWTDAVVRLRDPAGAWLARRGAAASGESEAAVRHNNAALDELFATADLLLTPTTPHPPHGHDGPGPVMNTALTWAFNLSGHPAVTVPAGLDADGRPVGLQIVAAHHRDDLLVAAARALEETRPWPRWSGSR